MALGNARAEPRGPRPLGSSQGDPVCSSVASDSACFRRPVQEPPIPIESSLCCDYHKFGSTGLDGSAVLLLRRRRLLLLLPLLRVLVPEFLVLLVSRRRFQNFPLLSPFVPGCPFE